MTQKDVNKDDIETTSYDFICIGSGAAGLMGALRAADRGARVLVLEATDLLGGTTSFSGANLWVPFNRWARQGPDADSRQRAEAYVKRCLGDRADDPRWSVFFDRINEVVEYIEQRTAVRFFPTRYPDSFGEWPEGTCKRHIGTDLLKIPDLGVFNNQVRRPPGLTVHLRYRDFDSMRIPFLFTRAAKLRMGMRILFRRWQGKVGMGYAFVLGMLEACLRMGVTFKLEHKVQRLVFQDGKVCGVAGQSPAGHFEFHAKQGVLIGSGGFDHNIELMKEYLPGTIEETMTPPVNQGDHIHFAKQVDAELAHMDEAWYLPGKVLPGAKPYEGKKIGTWLTGDRIWPHMLWVNSKGKRFVNESAQNSANAFYAVDSESGEQPNLTSWTILDNQFRQRYPILMSLYPGQEDPEWLIKADSIKALANKINVPADVLQSTIDRFNQFAQKGKDDDFQRGEGAYDHYFGDHRLPHHTLGTIEKPPFYAYKNSRSSVGTKGGIRINQHSQAIANDGSVIQGLYVAGNASAALNGPISVAAAATIPPALVAAMVAADHAIDRTDFSVRDTLMKKG